MKKAFLILTVLCLLMGAAAAAEGTGEAVLGSWKMACVLSELYFSEDNWEQYLEFGPDGLVIFTRDSQKSEGTWYADGAFLSSDLGGYLDHMQLMDNGLLLCGSYAQGYLFSRDGKMPSYERIEDGVSEDGFYYEQLGDGSLQITGHTSAEEEPVFDENGNITNMVDLVLPSSIRGLPVRAIGMNAFYANIRLRSVVIPEGVQHLSREAFNDCVALETVQLPESLTAIGGYAFSHCRNLQSVRIPAQVQHIRFNPFTNCTSIKTFDLADGNRWYHLDGDALVETATNHLIAFPAGTERTEFAVPDSITSLRLAAFMGCEQLETVVLPEGLTEMESYVFEDSGLKNVNIPSTLTVMEDNPFGNCRSLEQVNVSEQNTLFSSVDGVLFDHEKSRLIYYPMNKPGQTYTVPEGIQVIGADAFTRNRKLTTVILPSSLNAIEDYAFYKIRNLESMVIPEGVTEIGPYAFCECYNLRRITIPSTVKEIKRSVFGFCEDLQVIVPKDITIHEFAFEEAQRITITYQ